MLRMETKDGVALIELDRGETHPIGTELLTALGRALETVKEDPGLGSLVLAGARAKFLSIGFDIPALFPLEREEMRAFFRLFNATCRALFVLPKPTVAAIAGHAVAGGCILALCCDRRFIAEGRTLMGLNEVKLGVPVPCLADRILRDLVGTRHARIILEEGDFHPPEASLAMGIVDRILAPEGLREAAQLEAARLAVPPAVAFEMIKAERTREIVAQVERREGDLEDCFLDGWFSPPARVQLAAAMERF